MFTPAKVRRGMLTILGSFVGILIYKLAFHGLRDALLFLPAIGFWLLATTVVFLVTRLNQPVQPGA
jgi:hypothetical protein